MKIKVKYSLRPTSFLTKKTVPEKMGSFLFLGSLASNSCKDMKRRISLAATALGNMVQKRRRKKTEIKTVLDAYIASCIIGC